MILTQMNYYVGCQVTIFQPHPFLYIHLFVYVLLFFKRRIPLSLMHNKIKYFICVYKASRSYFT